MQRWFLAVALFFSIFATAIACGGNHHASSSKIDLRAQLDRTPPDDGDWTIEETRDFKDFDLYWLGEEFQSLPITQIIRVKTGPNAGSSQDSVWLIYGTCKPTGADGGCPAPLSILIERLCDRMQIYDEQRANMSTFRGSGEAASLGGGTPFYVWTGRVSIRISGLLEAAAADALVSLNGPEPSSPAEPLPTVALDC